MLVYICDVVYNQWHFRSDIMLATLLSETMVVEFDHVIGAANPWEHNNSMAIVCVYLFAWMKIHDIVFWQNVAYIDNMSMLMFLTVYHQNYP